jgi:hypothetical protein
MFSDIRQTGEAARRDRTIACLQTVAGVVIGALRSSWERGALAWRLRADSRGSFFMLEAVRCAPMAQAAPEGLGSSRQGRAAPAADFSTDFAGDFASDFGCR